MCRCLGTGLEGQNYKCNKGLTDQNKQRQTNTADNKATHQAFVNYIPLVSTLVVISEAVIYGPGWALNSFYYSFTTIYFSHVMFKDDCNAMHVQPSLPEVGIHGEDGLPVGSKLGLRRVFGSTVLQRQDLKEEGIIQLKEVCKQKKGLENTRILGPNSSLLTGMGRLAMWNTLWPVLI